MISRVVNQIFRGSTAAPGESARGSDSVFDGVRGLALEPRNFSSDFHQSFSNVPNFIEQATLVILFHCDSSLFLRFLRQSLRPAFANLYFNPWLPLDSPVKSQAARTSLRSATECLDSKAAHGRRLTYFD